jgi:hypothetical protein
MKRRQIILLPLGVIAVALIVAATAYACTPGGVRGETIITAPAGYNPATGPEVNPGDYIAASGTGAEPDRNFFLRFLNFRDDADRMMTCMGDAGQEVIIGGPRTSSSTGAIASTQGRIPTNAQSSDAALVCFVDDEVEYATNAALLVVL